MIVVPSDQANVLQQLESGQKTRQELHAALPWLLPRDVFWALASLRQAGRVRRVGFGEETWERIADANAVPVPDYEEETEEVQMLA